MSCRNAGGRAVIERFTSIAARFSDAVAVRDSGGVELTYNELYENAQDLADELLRAGVDPAELIAIDIPPGVESSTAFVAVWLLGGAYLPLANSGPSARNERIIADAAPQAVLTLAGGDADSPRICGRYLLALRRDSQKPPPGTAYVIYTSGTTGVPKGVPVSHENLAGLFDAVAPWFDVGLTDRWLVFHSTAFDFSVWELWGALSTGGTAVLPDGWTVRDPYRCAELIRRERISVLSQTPTAFQALAPELCAGSAESLRIRYVVFGGERLQPGLLEKFREISPAVLYNMYGITEITVHATLRRISLHDIERNESNIGEPLPGFLVRVVDEHDEPVAPGNTGELLLSGPQVVAGYLGRPELTAEKFTSSSGHVFYRSGDLVRWEGDGLVYVGRNDDQVKIRGHRIELGEVERALQAVPDVSAAVCVALRGGGVTRLACGYVTACGTELSRRTWQRALADRLPAHMIPEAFTRLETIPRTDNGKIDRTTLEKMFRRTP